MAEQKADTKSRLELAMENDTSIAAIEDALKKNGMAMLQVREEAKQVIKKARTKLKAYFAPFLN